MHSISQVRRKTYDTINDLLTEQQDGGVVLAGRYKIVRKLGGVG